MNSAFNQQAALTNQGHCVALCVKLWNGSWKVSRTSSKTCTHIKAYSWQNIKSRYKVVEYKPGIYKLYAGCHRRTD
uniref:Uncharacterized protein n=1 Tax=Anguilla anguilla TaxID=7936 RepID=A0A0E9X4T1_ANGAN